MSQAIENLKEAKARADEAYANWKKATEEQGKLWAESGYGATKEKLDPKKMLGLIKKHWKTISAVGAAFGVPVGLAPPGAFQKVFDLLGNFWPF